MQSLPHSKSTILVAEDHLDSREALRELLEAFGFDVIEAVDGRQAVAAAMSHTPSLILMDIMMPGMDGFAAIRALRAAPQTHGIPIIALTAMEGSREQALRAGANDYVGKPVDIRRLIGMVNGWMQRPLS
jgi:CheY-like chemotaxis protein